jgi:hypothetical protein
MSVGVSARARDDLVKFLKQTLSGMVSTILPDHIKLFQPTFYQSQQPDAGAESESY